MRLYGLLIVLVILLGSAAGLMARAGGDHPARALMVPATAYAQLVPGVTRTDELPKLGFDMERARPLPYLAMVERLMPENSTGFDALDPKVQDCLAARERCTAYLFPMSGRPGQRAMLVIEDGRLAYKTTEGLMQSADARPAY